MRQVLLYSFGLLSLLALPSCTRNHPVGVVKQTYIHQYGAEMTRDEWNARGQEGSIVSSMDDGVVVTKNYHGGVLDGKTTYTFPHSHIIATTETFAAGELQRKVTHYSTGIPKLEEQFLTNGQRQLTQWYEAGTPRYIEKYQGLRLIEGEYLDDKNNVESRIVNGEGFRIERDVYGLLKSKDQFSEGYLTLRTTYHPNGAPEAVTPYLKGREHGERKTFLAGGEPNTIEEWQDGQQDGVTSSFLNGEIVKETPYVNGKRHGIELHYRSGKRVVEEVSWNQDQRHGPAKRFIEGTTKTDWYFQGRAVSKLSYDELNGISR